MGAVDLVIQVESPKSVAAGLQRVGRAGHRLDEPSKGRIFPKFRGDLLECAVVVAPHARGRDRGDPHPAQPARRARAADRRDLGAGGDLGRRPPRPRARRLSVPRPLPRRSSRTCSTCSPAAIRRTSSPSCGRASPGTAPPGASAARDGARRLAVTNAGTIPDRGLYGVFLAGRRRPRRRARRGDGLRGARRDRCSCSARRRGGSKRSRATACSSRRPRESRARAVLEGRERGARRTSSARRSAAPRASSLRSRTTRRAERAARRPPPRRARRAGT